MPRIIDITGQKFGRLTALEMSEVNKAGNAVWKCLCDCGNYAFVEGTLLRKGNTKSCMCSRKDKRPWQRKHGDNGTRLYRIWSNMKNRCNNPRDTKKYVSYGGRGISICSGWNDYIQFRDWALNNGYSDKLTIDRIDNDGNYCPDNCRWATTQEQCMNRRSNHYVTENGETKTIKEWAEELGVSRSMILNRINKGGTIYE